MHWVVAMTPHEFHERMREIFPDDGYDPSAAHEVADRLLVDVLIDLGYQEGARVYLDADRDYD